MKLGMSVARIAITGIRCMCLENKSQTVRVSVWMVLLLPMEASRAAQGTGVYLDINGCLAIYALVKMHQIRLLTVGRWS